MATITTDTFLDGGVARTAGESHTITNGAKLTVRTDSRLHANAPAGFAGSMGSISFADIGGEFLVDARNVKWIPFTNGAGTVPAIGANVAQTAGTPTSGTPAGYFLGVWSALNAAPLAPGAAVPSTGYIKMREVTGGSYGPGSLTCGALTCDIDDAEKVGWIELAFDAASNFTVPRVGKFTTIGDWFELGTIDGTDNQQFQIPTTSATNTNVFCPGVWVETSPSSGEYEFWSGLNSSTSGWNERMIGKAGDGFTDNMGSPAKFVKTFGNGVVQIGEKVSLAATYAPQAAQASTYAAIALAATYTRVSNLVTVTFTAAHGFYNSQQVGFDFTTGTAVDGLYNVDVVDALTIKFTLTGADTSGNVTVRPGLTVTFTNHNVDVGDFIRLDFTSGTAVDSDRTVYAVISANAYQVQYPHTAAITAGNVSATHSAVITFTAHGLVAGTRVSVKFTTGDLVGYDFSYTVRTTAANTFNIKQPAFFTTGGNCTLNFDLGFIPDPGNPSNYWGCKVRIPNILFVECATASRNTNSVPNATVTNRPEFITTNSGDISLDNLTSVSGSYNFSGAYAFRMANSCSFHGMTLSRCATPFVVDNVGFGDIYDGQKIVNAV
jgi:hypothetical protein